jgi:geranylgeranyl diphosphate synthase type II
MDDYLDAYGDANKTGKQIGGDILANKKTFLSTQAYALSNENEKKEMELICTQSDAMKVENMLAFFERKQLREITKNEIKLYSDKAFQLLEKAPVLSKRKVHLMDLAEKLLNREY